MLKTELLVRMTYRDDPYDRDGGFKTDTINLGGLTIESQSDFDVVLEEVRKAMNMDDTRNYADYFDTNFDMYDDDEKVTVELVYCLRIGNKLFELKEVYE